MRRALLVLIVLVLTQLGVSRQSAADEADLRGKRVRATTANAAPIVGVLTDSIEGALLIRPSGQGDATRVSRDEILSLEVSRGFRRHTVRGLVGGALAWAAVVGLFAAFDTLDESGVGEPLFIGGMLAGGALVGRQFKTERWERLPVPAVSVQVVPHRRGTRAGIVLTF